MSVCVRVWRHAMRLAETNQLFWFTVRPSVSLYIYAMCMSHHEEWTKWSGCDFISSLWMDSYLILPIEDTLYRLQYAYTQRWWRERDGAGSTAPSVQYNISIVCAKWFDYSVCRIDWWIHRITRPTVWPPVLPNKNCIMWCTISSLPALITD